MKHFLQKDSMKRIGESLENIIFSVVDESFFYDQIESFDGYNITDFMSFDDGKNLSDHSFSAETIVMMSGAEYGQPNRTELAYRYRIIRKLYEVPLEQILDKPQHRRLCRNLKSLDKATKNWLTIAKCAIKDVCESSSGWCRRHTTSQSQSDTHIFIFALTIYSLSLSLTHTHKRISIHISSAPVVSNVVLTDELSPSLGKLMMFGLSKFVKSENVFAISNREKLHALYDIVSTMSVNCVYHLVGNADVTEKKAVAKLREKGVDVEHHLVHSVEDLQRLAMQLKMKTR